MKKHFFGFGCFASDVISEVVWPFWLMSPGLGLNRYTKVFPWSLCWILG